MPRLNRETQINAVLPPELHARLYAFLEERGQTLTHVVVRALTRHLDSPPPLAPEPPLPACDPDPPPAGKKRGRKPVGKKGAP